MDELHSYKMMSSIGYQQIHKQAFCVIFVSLAIFMGTMTAQADTKNGILNKLFISTSFVLPHYVNAWEILLIKILAECIEKKFGIINNYMINQKQTALCLKKVLPLSKPQTAIKFIEQEKKSTTQGIFQMIEVYYNLAEVSRRLNEHFQYPILITIAVNFEIITISLYYFLEKMIHAVYSPLEVIVTISWTVIFSIEVICILISFQKITSEVIR